MKNLIIAMFSACTLAVVPSIAQAGGGGNGVKGQPELTVVNTGNTILAVAVNNQFAEAVATDPSQQAEFVRRGGVVLDPGAEHTFKVTAGQAVRLAYQAFTPSGFPVGSPVVRTDITLERHEHEEVEIGVNAGT